MRILFLGDIVGRDARDEMIARLPALRKDLGLHAVIVNGENAANGFGITPQICDDLFHAGVDCVTTGNHVWDQREIIPHIERERRLLRPLNYPEGTPGRGSYIIETLHGKKILVANIMARLFMDAMDDPFAAADKLLNTHKMGRDVHAVIIDFHGEASSEKQAMGHFCDGRASLVVGTHTHVPTADARVLTGGTGYQTDAGMCGVYDSVIGMESALAVARFVRKMPGERMRPAQGSASLCGVVIETDDKTGLCTYISPLRIGGDLAQLVPDFSK